MKETVSDVAREVRWGVDSRGNVKRTSHSHWFSHSLPLPFPFRLTYSASSLRLFCRSSSGPQISLNLYCFVENLIDFPAVKECWKSVKIWRNYRHKSLVHFFETQCSFRCWMSAHWMTILLDSAAATLMDMRHPAVVWTLHYTVPYLHNRWWHGKALLIVKCSLLYLE